MGAVDTRSRNTACQARWSYWRDARLSAAVCRRTDGTVLLRLFMICATTPIPLDRPRSEIGVPRKKRACRGHSLDTPEELSYGLLTDRSKIRASLRGQGLRHQR
jgi:hypothetical protein